METTLIHDIKFNDKELHDQLTEYIDWGCLNADRAEAYCDYLRYDPEEEDSFDWDYPELSFDEKEFMKRLNDKIGIKSKPDENGYFSIVGEWIGHSYDNGNASVRFKPNEGDEIECLIYAHRGKTRVYIDFDEIHLRSNVSIQRKLENLFENRHSIVQYDMKNKSNMPEEEYKKDKKRVEGSIHKSIEYATIDKEHYDYPAILDILYEVQHLYEIEYFDDSLYKQLMSETLKKLKGQRYLQSYISYG